MELIRIGEGKLKVMLTEEDMALYALDDTASDCSGTETRRAVFAILDAAKAQIGFDVARDRVCIQMFRGRAGGCELFVSCTEKGGAPCRLLYAFPSASRLASACRVLAAQGFAGASAAYLGDDGRLFLSLETPRGHLRPDPLDVLAEYGTAMPGGTAFLGEHAELITADAVATLSPLSVT